MGKIEPLQNTPYVEECCNEIEKQHEYLSDRYLVFQVRVQSLADAGMRSFPFPGVDYWDHLGTEAITMLVKSFERDLERFKNTLDPELVQSSMHHLSSQTMSSHSEHFTDSILALYRIHLSSVSIHNSKIALRSSASSESSRPTSSSERLSLLMTCLQSTKKFFADWFSLPSSIYHWLPINVFILVAHAAVVLGILNSFQYDAWDLEYVRQIAPFASTMDRLARKYEAASREVDNGENGGCSTFCKEGKKMKRLVDWYEARLSGLNGQQEQHSGDQEREIGLEFDILNDWYWNETLASISYHDAEQ
jgi:hypothetical protein